MKIGDMMNRNLVTIPAGSTRREAAERLGQSSASDLMVTSESGAFAGVLSEGDLIRAILPKFDELMASSGSMSEAYEAIIEEGRVNASRSIDGLVIKEPITLKPTDEALKAATTMTAKRIRRLPVLDDGKLVGTVSRADVCLALLKEP